MIAKDPVTNLVEKDPISETSQKTVITETIADETPAHPTNDEGCFYFERQQHTQPCVTSDEALRVVSHRTRSDEYFLSLINFAYALGGKDFVLTLNAENGAWDKDSLSSRVGANGYRDQGLCQLNRQYHLPFIESDDFDNPYIQLRYCYDVYHTAELRGRLTTTFYGYNHRHRRDNGFIFQK